MLGDGGDEEFELGYVASLDAANGLAGRARLPGLVVGLATRFFEGTEIAAEVTEDPPDEEPEPAYPCPET